MDRIQAVRTALHEAGLDAIVCALPANVLMLTGYWPVTGTAVAVATRDETAVLAPEDEEDIAEGSSFASVRRFTPGSLMDLRDTTGAVRRPLLALARRLGLQRARIGVERRAAWQPAPYASMHLYLEDLPGLLVDGLPAAHFTGADRLLDRLRSVKTPQEVERIRSACVVAARAFAVGARHLVAGLRETMAAAAFRTPLSTAAVDAHGVQRADGFAWCMSGPHAALAYGAYARSGQRRIQAGDLALVHCNSYVDGYWTDLTRTYCMGDPDERQERVYEAVFAARAAALHAIGPGVRASDVDRAARDVLEERGFGRDFKHPTGHGVGFLAIDHNAAPRLHPKSAETLETGMVFNVEPAIYRHLWGGCRHCDMVTVTARGAELLSDFQTRPEDLVVDRSLTVADRERVFA
jgi:Xaa-Pro dipeptidase